MKTKVPALAQLLCMFVRTQGFCIFCGAKKLPTTNAVGCSLAWLLWLIFVLFVKEAFPEFSTFLLVCLFLFALPYANNNFIV